MMRRVNEAWQVLGDRDARAVYDEVYFAWRTGSEQLAGELSGRLSMQQERRQARATSQEWIRWGREDRGRWGREQRRDAGARERESRGAGRNGDGSSARRGARRESQPAAGAGRPEGEGRDDRERDIPDWAPVAIGLSMVATIVIVIAVAIANSS